MSLKKETRNEPSFLRGEVFGTVGTDFALDVIYLCNLVFKRKYLSFH